MLGIHLRRNPDLPVYVKGVQSEEDVARALDAGAQRDLGLKSWYCVS